MIVEDAFKEFYDQIDPDGVLSQADFEDYRKTWFAAAFFVLRKFDEADGMSEQEATDMFAEITGEVAAFINSLQPYDSSGDSPLGDSGGVE